MEYIVILFLGAAFTALSNQPRSVYQHNFESKIIPSIFENMLTINQRLQQGRFRISKRFGRGKIVSYYAAFDSRFEKKILLKRILIQTNETGNSVEENLQAEWFSAKSKFLASIQDDRFLNVLDHFHEGDSRYLVMELVDGKNIGEICRKSEEPFAIADVVNWGEQILDSLDYLHKQSPPIMYFNVRPWNIHLTSDAKVKLLATGIGGRWDENVDPDYITIVLSNLSYVPLELIWMNLDAGTKRVLSNKFDEKSETMLLFPPDASCDTYSVGATLYHLLTNQAPIDSLERSIEILEGKSDPLVPASELNSLVSAEISDFLNKSMQISREHRFQTSLEMRIELVNAFNKLKERRAQALRSEVPAALGTPATTHETEASPGDEFVGDVPTINIEAENMSAAENDGRIESEEVENVPFVAFRNESGSTEFLEEPVM